MGLIARLNRFGFDLPLDRISTNPLENVVGLLRRFLHDWNRFDEVPHGTARNAIVNRLCHELGHPQRICGWENVAGTLRR
jgi:hypothetical protein